MKILHRITIHDILNPLDSITTQFQFILKYSIRTTFTVIDIDERLQIIHNSIDVYLEQLSKLYPDANNIRYEIMYDEFTNQFVFLSGNQFTTEIIKKYTDNHLIRYVK